LVGGENRRNSRRCRESAAVEGPDVESAAEAREMDITTTPGKRVKRDTREVPGEVGGEATAVGRVEREARNVDVVVARVELVVDDGAREVAGVESQHGDVERESDDRKFRVAGLELDAAEAEDAAGGAS
jgi:hypothetical protein